MENLFIQASRIPLRFSSLQGDLTVEQLWQLPLSSQNVARATLDGVAKHINRALKDAEEESFVETKANPAKELNELRLEIVKFIIATKQAENAEKLNAADRAAEKQRLLGLLETKKAAALEQLSEEDIQKRLDALK